MEIIFTISKDIKSSGYDEVSRENTILSGLKGLSNIDKRRLTGESLEGDKAWQTRGNM